MLRNMEQSKKNPTIKELQAEILDASVRLVKLVDQYREALKADRGNEHSAVTDNRCDAYEMVTCAAIDILAEAGAKTDEEFDAGISRILAEKGVADDKVS